MVQPSQLPKTYKTAAIAPPRSRPRGSSYQGRIYEDDLNADPRWALSEGSRFFEGGSRVQEALAKITRRLNDLDIPYCVVGGMALFQHGYRRFTEDVNILVTREGWKKIHEELSGLGYLPPFARSKNLRDVELGVRIEFLIAGEYPGDGRPKPVAFPDPADVGVEQEGIKYLNLPRLIELKLASGITAPGRMKDLADVLELIKLLDLPRDLSEQLSSFVRPKFDELWQQSRKRFMALWPHPLPNNAQNIEEMIAMFRKAAEELETMRADGVTLWVLPNPSGNASFLVTTDPAAAKKYDMDEESEFWSGMEIKPDGDYYSN